MRSKTINRKSYTTGEQTAALKDMFEPWMGEYPNVREITFKPNMNNFTVFVVYDDVVEDDYNDY